MGKRKICQASPVRSKEPRRHAWHRPFEPSQFAPWVALFSSFGCVFGFLVPLGVYKEEAFIASYGICTVIMLVFGLMATVFVSPHVPKEDNHREGPNKCEVCGVARAPEWKTHHCSSCNRCSDSFDHRELFPSLASSVKLTSISTDCPWINTCVSKRNLYYFYGLCYFSVLIFCLHFAYLGYVRALHGPFTGGTIAGIVVLSILPGIALIGLVSILGHLMYFRVVLGISTYEYLVRKGEKKGQAMLDEEAKKFESKRANIEEEQARIREEWRKNREKEMLERKERSTVKNGINDKLPESSKDKEVNHDEVNLTSALALA